jgi:hypothetical protein
LWLMIIIHGFTPIFLVFAHILICIYEYTYIKQRLSFFGSSGRANLASL